MSGYTFTWEKSPHKENWVEERLDRALAAIDWRCMFPAAVVHNILMVSSDHSALFLDLADQQFRPSHRFRFEMAWSKEPYCKERVLAVWNRSGEVCIQEKLAVCGSHLNQWGMTLRRKFKRDIQNCRDIINRLKGTRDPNLFHELNLAQSDLGRLLEQQELYWSQRAKQHWLKEGDSNTRYFHLSTSNRRRVNTLSKLRDAHGNWCDWDTGLPNVIADYFTDLFQSKGCDSEAIL